MLARCAAETAALRVAAAQSPDAARVLLTASEGLPGLAGRLGGPHVRVTHDVITTQDRPLRLLDRLTCRWRGSVAVVCPTAAVRDVIASEHPGIPAVVRPFTLAEPGDRISEHERAVARCRYGIQPGQIVITMVGGWWPYKDIATVNTALAQLTGRPHVFVAGTPLDEDLLTRWRALLGRRLKVKHYALPNIELRAVYAVTDLLLVARKPGVATESGLVCDAARYGIPLVASGHDPRLRQQLDGQPWARTFIAGNPVDLARVLDAAIATPPARPDARAAARLGLLTPAQALCWFTELHRSLPSRSRR